MTNESTLTIVVESETGFHERVRDALEGIEAGEPVDQTRLLSVENTAALDRILRQTNLTLIQTIAAETPASMRETARLVGRDIKDVSRNLHELAEFGVIDLEPAGRSKRPVVWYDEIDVRVPVRTGSDDDTRSRSAP